VAIAAQVSLCLPVRHRNGGDEILQSRAADVDADETFTNDFEKSKK
jgi:hypothetical protein